MNGKKHKLIISIEIILAFVLLVAITVFAAQPGSSDDPLAAKSYVDDKFNQIMSILNSGSSGSSNVNNIDKDAIVNEVIDKIEPVIAVMLQNNEQNNQNSQTPESNGKYVPVYASVGQVIVGGEGTEIILRSGKAKAYITGVAGVVNITTGKEINNGGNITLNNLIVIPRDDGRGVKVTENAWFMIKGEYKFLS